MEQWNFNPIDWRVVYLHKMGWERIESYWLHSDVGYWFNLEDALLVQEDLEALSWRYSQSE